MAKSKVRTVRVDDQLWDEAQRIAKDRRESLGAVMKVALVEYVLRHGGTVERPKRVDGSTSDPSGDV